MSGDSINHQHGWFRTGEMQPGQYRCIHCGKWGHEVDADEALLRQVLEAMEHLHRTGDTQVFDLCYAPELIPALRARLGEKA